MKPVAQGHPVPVDVSGEEDAHAMTIAQDGDMLQVYNPWGSTTWVSEGDFINGYMGKACNSDIPNAYSACLPRRQGRCGDRRGRAPRSRHGLRLRLRFRLR